MPKKILIIGGNAAGLKTATRLKRLDPESEVIVLEKGENVSLGACGLPYFIADVVKEQKELMSTPIGVVRDAAFFKNVKRVTIIPRTEAREIDREKKIVKAANLENGEEREFSYDQLVLTLGGYPGVPLFEGVDLNNVFTLSTGKDGQAIKKYFREGKPDNAVIVGAGLIGMEMAEAFDIWGAEVSVVEMLEWVFPTILDQDMGLILERYLAGEGINVYTSEKVLRFEGNEKRNVVKVCTDKREIKTDLVLLATGVRPNVELARKAGLELGKTGAILVNEFLQTSDPDIYAGGDCVENRHLLTGNPVYAPMGSTANKHGRVIADNITGSSLRYPGVLGTAICKVLDFSVGRTGLSEKEAYAEGYEVETIICPGHDRPHFYPGRANIIIKLIAEKKSGKLLGAQILGPGEVAKRTEIAVSALTMGATVQQLSTFDLAYAPPYSPAMDNIITAANIMNNKLKGLAKGISPLIVKERMDKGDDFILLDVRSPQEYETVRIEHHNMMLIPLGKLGEECKKLPRDKEIITFCQFSLRGYEAQRILEEKGFKNVKFMDGGVVGWPFETIGKIW